MTDTRRIRLGLAIAAAALSCHFPALAEEAADAAAAEASAAEETAVAESAVEETGVSAAPAGDTRYFGVLGTYTITDDERSPVDYGGGVHVFFGKQYSEKLNFEWTGSASIMETDSARSDFYRYALGFDALYFLNRNDFAPYLLGGVGIVHNDVLESFGDDETDPYVNAGVGFIKSSIAGTAMALRGDVRVVHDFYEDDFTDVRVGLGLQIPLAALTGAPAAVATTDSDGDGVVDGVDRCPGTMRGLKVDQYGCAVAQTFVLKGVSFDFDSTRLGVNAQTILEATVETMLGQPSLKAEIAGHTDNYGSDDYNKDLSQRRADAVREYLISKNVNAGNLRATGYGESEPVASNDTDFGREQNRRVEFRIESQ